MYIQRTLVYVFDAVEKYSYLLSGHSDIETTLWKPRKNLPPFTEDMKL